MVVVDVDQVHCQDLSDSITRGLTTCNGDIEYIRCLVLSVQ